MLLALNHADLRGIHDTWNGFCFTPSLLVLQIRVSKRPLRLNLLSNQLIVFWDTCLRRIRLLKCQVIGVVVLALQGCAGWLDLRKNGTLWAKCLILRILRILTVFLMLRKNMRFPLIATRHLFQTLLLQCLFWGEIWWVLVIYGCKMLNIVLFFVSRLSLLYFCFENRHLKLSV